MNNKDTDHQMPPVALLRICRCNALVVGTNACPHCNAGWAEVKAPVTQYTRVDPPAAPTCGPCSACGDGDTAMRYHNHDSPAPDEADKALAQGILHGFTLGYEVTKILERRALAALAQARKEGAQAERKQVLRGAANTIYAMSRIDARHESVAFLNGAAWMQDKAAKLLESQIESASKQEVNQNE